MNATTATLTENRWYVYQRERFPLLAHGVLIAAFSSSAVSFSWLLRDPGGLPSVSSLFTAFVSALLLFLQLRIADEFKDFDEDCRYRPYRPVPRGLVKLRELAVLAVAGALLQLGLALWLSPPLVPLLLVTWGYLALMTREFFVRDWIRERPITYLWSHMLILPLADFYATACDWQPAGGGPPAGLPWFIAVSFFNGLTLELGRKIRAAGDEEDGVRTYSLLWGPRRATLAWLACLTVTAGCAVAAAAKIGTVAAETVLVAVVMAVGALLSWQFVRRPVPARAQRLNHFTSLWTLLLYLSLGMVPLLWRLKGALS